MYKSLAILVAGACLAAIACDRTSTSGGPGVANDPKARETGITQTENTFSLDVPNLATKVEQGETDTVTIGIRRGKNFDSDVNLKLDNPPSGVTFTPAAPVIKRSEKEVKISVTAAETAALGDHTVKVHGTPSTGPAATSEFKITVAKK